MVGETVRRIDNRILLGFGLLVSLIVVLSYLTLFSGVVGLSWSDLSLRSLPYDSVQSQIFWEIRVPRLVAAVLSGISLAAAGLSLQTLFRNPLAGPFVLGISSGASLGVALSLLAGFSFGCLGVLSAASVGALVVTFMIMAVAARFENSTVLLIVGLLMGYFIDALVSLLIVGSDAESLRVYVSWGMGSFGRLTFDSIGSFAFATMVGLVLLLLSIRYLNAARLGDDFAKGLGLNVRRSRMMVLLGASLLAGASTAFCGPVAFVGIAVPHLAFMLFKTGNHRVLIPASALCGIVLCLAASQFSKVPLNAVLSLVGVPVILWVIVRGGGVRK